MKKHGKRTLSFLDPEQFWMILLAAWITVIYAHSLVPAGLSSEESGWAMTRLLEVLSFLGSDGKWVSEHLVRKSAHFAEYAVFGILLIKNFICRWNSSSWNAGRIKRSLWEKLAPVVLAVMAVPFVDETIQLFVAGRSGQLSDVWLDMAGAVCGIGLRALVLFLICRAQLLFSSSRRSRRQKPSKPSKSGHQVFKEKVFIEKMASEGSKGR